jgi:hypothetical protein
VDNDRGVPLEIYSFLILELFVATNVFSFDLNQVREHVEERLNALEVTCIYSDYSERQVGYGTDFLTHIGEALQILLHSDCLKTEKTIRESQVVNLDDDRYSITHHGLKILGDKTCFNELDQKGDRLISMGILKPGGEIVSLNKWDIPIELVGPMVYHEYQESKPTYHPSDFYYG